MRSRQERHPKRRRRRRRQGHELVERETQSRNFGAPTVQAATVGARGMPADRDAGGPAAEDRLPAGSVAECGGKVLHLGERHGWR
ncbi:hypothetical protein ACFX2I_009036 [Malus domestica]